MYKYKIPSHTSIDLPGPPKSSEFGAIHLIYGSSAINIIIYTLSMSKITPGVYSLYVERMM